MLACSVSGVWGAVKVFVCVGVYCGEYDECTVCVWRMSDVKA